MNQENWLISLSEMVSNRLFQDALPGHFIHYGDLADERIELFLKKINEIGYGRN